jgi:hypothetical protein
LQKSTSVTEAQRSADPLATIRVTGSKTREDSRKEFERAKGDDGQLRGGEAAKLEEARDGRSRGRCGARVLVRWKALRIVPLALVHTNVGQRSWRLSGVAPTREQGGCCRGRRQGRQRLGRHR